MHQYTLNFPGYFEIVGALLNSKFVKQDIRLHVKWLMSLIIISLKLRESTKILERKRNV